MFRIYLILTIISLLHFGCKKVKAQNDIKEINSNDYIIEYGSDEINLYYLEDNSKMDGHYIIKRDSLLQEEFSAKNGLLSGEYKYYFPNGKLAQEVLYINGMKNGEERFYFTSGKLKSIENYRKNKALGNFIEYYEDGSTHIKRTVENGKSKAKFYRDNKLIGEEYDIKYGEKIIGVSKVYNSSGGLQIVIGFEMIENIMKDDILYLLDENDIVRDSINPEVDKIKAMQIMMMAGKGM